MATSSRIHNNSWSPLRGIVYVGVLSRTFRHVALMSLTCMSLSLGACRFVAPSASDNAELAARGAFNGGRPAWAQTNDASMTTLPAQGGVIPQTLTVPEAVSLSATASASSATRPELGKGIAQNTTSNMTQQSAFEKSRATNSMSTNIIDRIESDCIGSQKTVSDTLQNVDQGVRINTYQMLTKRCPSSADLWALLGREYASLGKLREARLCLQNAEKISPENPEAAALRSDIEKR